MYLFVYGTLLAGMSRHTSLAGTRRLGPASVQGTLWDFGSYPGLKEGSGVVTGELHEVDGDVLRRVDEVEGFDPQDPSGSLYVRNEVPARRFSDGTRVQAVTYFSNRATTNAALIANGDYRRHKAAAKDDQVLVIAYGSNLSPQRLAPRMKWDEQGTGRMVCERLAEALAEGSVFIDPTFTVRSRSAFPGSRISRPRSRTAGSY